MICPTCRKEICKPKMHTATFTSSHFCLNCKEEHVVWENIKVGDYAVEWNKYRIYCDTHNNRSMVQEVYMDIESDTSIMYRWYTILELPAIPTNLTAETIERKLKTILLFS